MERMNIVITGHVDHGKSTLVGRLLADTGSLPQGKLESVKNDCAKNARPFEYSMLLDALADEQRQGITIDSARIFFKSAVREYVIIDAPGHVEFLKNMLSGASRAAAAVLVIDAAEGVAENSRRHGLLLSLLGIAQVTVVINKLDKLGFDRAVYDAISQEYGEFLKALGVTPKAFIPASAREGINLTVRSDKTPWYQGPTMLEALDGFTNSADRHHEAFALPLQDVYRFSNNGDDRRIYAGTVESGTLQAGKKVRFLPSGKEATIKRIESFNTEPKSAIEAGEAVGLTLNEEIYVRPGEVMVSVDNPAELVTGDLIRANIFWLGKRPLQKNRDYRLKLGTARVSAKLKAVERHIDAQSLQESSGSEAVNRHEAATVLLSLKEPIAANTFSKTAGLGRFVLVDEYDTAGGGIVLEVLDDKNAIAGLNELERHQAFEAELKTLIEKYYPEWIGKEKPWN